MGSSEPGTDEPACRLTSPPSAPLGSRKPTTATVAFARVSGDSRERDAYPPVDVRYPVRNCRCAINTPDTGWRCKNSIFPTEPSDGIVDVMVRYNESSPSALSTIDLWCLGGAVGDVPRDATTFWHRDKPLTLNFEADWENATDDETNVDWVRNAFAEVEALPVPLGRYGNFPGVTEDPTHLLFGENYDRLVEPKTTYDPENAFRRNQNVEPRTEAAG